MMNRHFTYPDLLTEFQFKTSRSGGAGGQNVNKVATKVQIDFDILHSQQLTPSEKDILLGKLKGRLSQLGLLQVVSQTERTQLGNKEVALKKMYRLLNKCFETQKKRLPTKPHKGSVESRLSAKKYHSVIKRNRNQTFQGDTD